jgi:hypothetical protein
MEELQNVTEVAKGITDYGMLAVTAAFFLILSAAMMIACFKWLKSLISQITERNEKSFESLLNATSKQNDMLADIAEGLRPETQLRIKNTTNTYFDLAAERVCRIIRKVRKENHIVDHDATMSKINTLLLNLHEDRNSRFDSYTFRGKRLTTYTSAEWVDWVAEVVEKEVYNEKENLERTYTNVQAVYEKIKLDFYHRLNN